MSVDGRAKVPKPGAHLDVSADAARHERRILTALSYDLVGSTKLLDLLDMEEFEDIVSEFQHAVKQAIISCSGTLRVEAGDGGVAVFPIDIGPNDAASLAIRAGLDIVDACRRLGERKGRSDLHVRVGIATSMTLVLKGDDLSAKDNITGSAFALAARLQALAKPDTVLVSDETRGLARRSHVFSFRGEHAIKGFAESKQIWQALNHKREVDRFFAFGRMTSPLIDRVDEFTLVQNLWQQAISGRGRAILLEGEAGIGKSRIVHELRRNTHRQRHRLLFFQCTLGDSHSTLHPLRQTVQGSYGESALTPNHVANVFSAHNVNDEDVVSIFSFLLGTESIDPEFKEMSSESIQARVNWAIRRSLQSMCAGGPVMLIVEDIHWIDMTSKQMLNELAKNLSEFPLLLIATARPRSSGWLKGCKRIALKPLEHADTVRAIETMWPKGKRAPAPELTELVERVAGGIPLFIEEVCQWLAETADTGHLSQNGASSRASVLERVLDARLETLGMAREVARAAAVVGNRFSLDVLSALLPEYDQASVSEAVNDLVKAGFVIRTRPMRFSQFGFRHALMQETIYHGTLRKRRQLLHQRLFVAARADNNLAGWLTTAALAEHAERAGLIEEAIGALVNAGIESSSRSAMAEGRQLLERALSLCEQVADNERRDGLKLSAMVALGPILTALEGPNSEFARMLYEDGVKIARRRPAAERSKWFPIYWGWWFTGSVVDGERAKAVVKDLEGVADAEVQLQARHCLWAVDFNRGSHDGCIAAVDAGLPFYDSDQWHANATRFGGHDAKVCALAHRGLSLWFSGHATSALRYIAEARGWAQQTGHASSIAHACINEAMLHSHRRDFASLRRVIADLRHLTEHHHLPSLMVSAQIFEGWCDGNEGDLAGGEEKMRRGLGMHGEVQTPEDEPVYYSMLAEILARSGRIEDALALLRSAIAQTETGGSRYWEAELHRRSAQLEHHRGSSGRAVAAFQASLVIAADQNAVPLLIGAYEALERSNVSGDLLRQYSARVSAAKATLEPGEPLVVNPEPEL